MVPFRADHVGSLLRSAAVLEAHTSFVEGGFSLEELRGVEDKAIDDALALQKQVGFSIFSDGEIRRATWANDFADAVDGYVDGAPAILMSWRGQFDPAVAASTSTTGGRVIGERLRQVRRLTGHESAYLKEHAPGAWKMTMPSPSYIVARGYKPGVTDKVYADRKEVLAEVARIVNGEIKALIDEGVRYIQLDNPHYPDFIDAQRREQWRAIGIDPDVAILEDIEADNACVHGIDRDSIVLATHLCRGNGGRAGWHTSGGYDSIAEQVFGGLDVDRFLLEYDSERAGGFEPLRFMPRGKTVVLGLITTKEGRLESEDEIIRRIDEASRYVALDDLALSPQCGFASVMSGNPVTLEEQRRKLELVVSVARRVWGTAD